MPALLVATGQTGQQRAPGTQLAPGSANSGGPWQCHPHPTHHGAIGLHAAQSGQGVLGIDCHHHLAAGLVPVLPAQHRLLVLPGRGTHHGTAGAQAPPKQGMSEPEDAPLQTSFGLVNSGWHQLNKNKLCLLCRLLRGDGSCKGGQLLLCPMQHGHLCCAWGCFRTL